MRSESCMVIAGLSHDPVGASLSWRSNPDDSPESDESLRFVTGTVAENLVNEPASCSNNRAPPPAVEYGTAGGTIGGTDEE